VRQVLFGDENNLDDRKWGRMLPWFDHWQITYVARVAIGVNRFRPILTPQPAVPLIFQNIFAPFCPRFLGLPHNPCTVLTGSLAAHRASGEGGGAGSVALR
jgi:hypothetical protein